MSALAAEIDHALKDLDQATAVRFERLVRVALELVRPSATHAGPRPSRDAWLQRLSQLRASVGTAKQGTSTEAIIDDLRSEDR